MIARMLRPIRALLLRRRFERDMQEEMAEHLQRAEDRLRRRGLSPAEARYEAQREFGNLAQVQEAARDARGGRWITDTIGDLRFGVRHLAATPVTTATMIVVLALAIGLSTALFTTQYSIEHMPPAAIPRDPSLVRIRGIDHGVPPGAHPGREISWPEYRAHAAQRQIFDDVAAWSGTEVLIDVGRSEPSVHSGTVTYVTDNYFRVLGVRLPLGALPAVPPEEPSTPVLAGVISHRMWERYFGGSADVIGKTVKVNGHSITITGVTPPRFSGTAMGGSQLRIWMPFNARAVVRRGSTGVFTSWDSLFVRLGARLTPGVTMAQALHVVQATAQRAALSSSVRSSYSADVAALRATNVEPPMANEGADRSAPWLTLAFFLCVLLIPCTNVSALLAGRAVARQREVGVRLALGASRRRLVRQLLTESVLLSLVAGGVGIWILWMILRIYGTSIPDLGIALHWPVLLFTLGFALLVGVLFGISPALHATRVSVVAAINDSAGSISAPRFNLQAGLVVAQLACTQPLLFLVWGLVLTVRDDPRLRVPPSGDHIVQLRFAPIEPTRRGSTYEETRRLVERLSRLPEVAGAVPYEGFRGGVTVAVPVAERAAGVAYRDQYRLTQHTAAPAYFEAMSIPIIRGRAFAHQSTEAGDVIVGTGLARELFGTADVVGRRLQVLESTNQGSLDPQPTTLTVVGVVDDRPAGLTPGERQIFVPTLDYRGDVLVRTHGPAAPLVPYLQAAATAEAPQLNVYSARTLAAIANEQRETIRRSVTVATTVGVIALVVAGIGLYAVVAAAVARRTRDIGIRTALGANRRRVIGHFLARGVKLSLLGTSIGFALSWTVLRAIVISGAQGLPYGTGVGGVVLGLLTVVVALIATWIPARRAASVDAMVALRAE